MEKKPLPADVLLLTPTTDDLALRVDPALDGALLLRFPAATVLKSLEAREAAQAKIGVDGQWINVQSPQGDQGFVAAWYVKAVEAFGPSMAISEDLVAPESGPETLTVKVIEDQLAFRSQPAVADDNLIARLPLGAVLTVIDAQSAQKLGVINEWLKVRDAEGREGYVAAWYVAR